ncbi:MAG: hypothetical protein IJ125_09945, partial [Atopobiaceae bacterium]|nr:hypothetical protein [Atopobiaceae bacterium]
PKGSMGGEDISIMIRLPYKEMPLEVPYGESVAVELLDPEFVFNDNGRIEFRISGLKAINTKDGK